MTNIQTDVSLCRTGGGIAPYLSRPPWASGFSMTCAHRQSRFSMICAQPTAQRRCYRAAQCGHLCTCAQPAQAPRLSATTESTRPPINRGIAPYVPYVVTGGTASSRTGTSVSISPISCAFPASAPWLVAMVARPLTCAWIGILQRPALELKTGNPPKFRSPYSSGPPKGFLYSWYFGSSLSLT